MPGVGGYESGGPGVRQRHRGSEMMEGIVGKLLGPPRHKAPDTSLCHRCENREVMTEYARLTGWEIGQGITEAAPAMPDSSVKVYKIARCKADKVGVIGQLVRDEQGRAMKGQHPFGPKNNRAPVLTCREMRMNGCKAGELFEGPAECNSQENNNG